MEMEEAIDRHETHYSCAWLVEMEIGLPITGLSSYLGSDQRHLDMGKQNLFVWIIDLSLLSLLVYFGFKISNYKHFLILFKHIKTA